MRTTDARATTDAMGKHFGNSDVYDIAELNSTNAARAIPCPRVSGNARDEMGQRKEVNSKVSESN